MVPPPTVPPPLWTFLYGRRQHRRHDLACEAVLHGPAGPLACHIADVSAGGMLLHLARATLTTDADATRGLVSRNFGLTFRVDLLATDISVGAALARLAWRPGDEDHVYAGCRFPRPLDERTLSRLGIEPELGANETTGRPASTCLPLGTTSKSGFNVSLHEVGADPRVPLHRGTLVGAGRNTLAANLEDTYLDAVATSIDGRELVIAVTRGLEPMWTVRSRAMAARPLQEGGVEIVLLADSAPAELLTAELVPSDDVAPV